MKGRKEHEHREHRETGGFNAAKEDVDTKPMRYTADSKVNSEAEEKKRGGRTKRAHGGKAEHHGQHGKECKECHGGRAERKRGGHVMHEKKHVGEVMGEHAKHHAGRKPRKSGGRTGSDGSPFSSARHGTPASGRKVEMEMD
jgi:hypothetical protein